MTCNKMLRRLEVWEVKTFVAHSVTLITSVVNIQESLANAR